MVILIVLLLAGTAWSQTPTGVQTQGPLTVEGRGGETPSVSGTLDTLWDPRTHARWKAAFQDDQQVLELHLSRNLNSELEAALHISHEWREATRVSADVAFYGLRLGVSATDRGRTEISLSGSRAALRVAMEAGLLQGSLGARVMKRGWFTVEGSADSLGAGYRYRRGDLSVGARARRTWNELGPVDSVESDLFYRW